MPKTNDLRPQVEPTLIRSAWTDEAFKEKLMSDATSTYSEAITNAGGELHSGTEVKVLAESADQIYLVIPSEGLPEGLNIELDDRSSRGEFEISMILRAQQDAEFKKALLSDAKSAYEGVMGEVREGASLPGDLKVSVVQETGDVLYFRLPQAPEGIDAELSDADLEQAAGGGRVASDGRQAPDEVAIVAAACALASTVCVGVAVAVALL